VTKKKTKNQKTKQNKPETVIPENKNNSHSSTVTAWERHQRQKKLSSHSDGKP
jgi:hypothetical protein